MLHLRKHDGTEQNDFGYTKASYIERSYGLFLVVPDLRKSNPFH